MTCVLAYHTCRTQYFGPLLATWDDEPQRHYVQFVLPGDFDDNGDVDGADFLYWQLNDGSQLNLIVWQNQFGQITSTVAAIPEPATILLAMLGMTSVCCWRRRR